MTDFYIHSDITRKLPGVRLGCIQCSVKVAESDEKIIALAQTTMEEIMGVLTMEAISQKPTIMATKEAYRSLGKDPSRYRPSAEALTRRVVSGKGLYQVNNIVDLLNLVSLKSGFSIGGYDANRIDGDITFGVGKENEPYQAIGRGALNIADMPLFRDSVCAFGSPTSDSLRTMVTEQTTSFLMVIIDFVGDKNLQKSIDLSIELLKNYAGAHSFETKIISHKI